MNFATNASIYHELHFSTASADWERELQQELQDFEVVVETEKADENWDKEIEELLQAED